VLSWRHSGFEAVGLTYIPLGGSDEGVTYMWGFKKWEYQGADCR